MKYLYTTRGPKKFQVAFGSLRRLDPNLGHLRFNWVHINASWAQLSTLEFLIGLPIDEFGSGPSLYN